MHGRATEQTLVCLVTYRDFLHYRENKSTARHDVKNWRKMNHHIARFLSHTHATTRPATTNKHTKTKREERLQKMSLQREMKMRKMRKCRKKALLLLLMYSP